MLCDLGYILFGDSLVRVQCTGFRLTECFKLLLSTIFTIPGGVINCTDICIHVETLTRFLSRAKNGNNLHVSRSA